MSYYQDKVPDYIDNSGNQESFIQAIGDFLTPKDTSDWMQTFSDIGFTSLSGATGGLHAIISDPAIRPGLINAIKDINKLNIYTTMTFGVYSVTQSSNMPLEAAKQITLAGAGILGGWSMAYLGTAGLLPLIPFAANPVGAVALAIIGGYVTVQIINKGGWDYITDNIANGILDVYTLADGIVDDIDDMVDYIFNEMPEDITNGLSDIYDTLRGYVDNVSSLADDALTAIGTALTQSTPLILDLDGDGIELAPLGGEGSVYWDID